MKKHLVALAILPMGVALMYESGEHRFVTIRETTVESYSPTLADNSHTHFEIEDDSLPSTSVLVFASGGQHREERFALHIRPESGGFRLIGYPSSGGPNCKPQIMYGFCENIEAVTDRLARLGLPTAQLEAVRRSALDGVEQQIGGHRGLLLLPCINLARIGMCFRPPDC